MALCTVLSCAGCRGSSLAPVEEPEIAGLWTTYNGHSANAYWFLEDGLAIIEQDLEDPGDVAWGSWVVVDGAIKITLLHYDPAVHWPPEIGVPIGKRYVVWIDIDRDGLHLRSGPVREMTRGSGRLHRR